MAKQCCYSLVVLVAAVYLPALVHSENAALHDCPLHTQLLTDTNYRAVSSSPVVFQYPVSPNGPTDYAANPVHVAYSSTIPNLSFFCLPSGSTDTSEGNLCQSGATFSGIRAYDHFRCDCVNTTHPTVGQYFIAAIDPSASEMTLYRSPTINVNFSMAYPSINITSPGPLQLAATDKVRISWVYAGMAQTSFINIYCLGITVAGVTTRQGCTSFSSSNTYVGTRAASCDCLAKLGVKFSYAIEIISVSDLTVQARTQNFSINASYGYYSVLPVSSSVMVGETLNVTYILARSSSTAGTYIPTLEPMAARVDFLLLNFPTTTVAYTCDVNASPAAFVLSTLSCTLPVELLAGSYYVQVTDVDDPLVVGRTASTFQVYLPTPTVTPSWSPGFSYSSTASGTPSSSPPLPTPSSSVTASQTTSPTQTPASRTPIPPHLPSVRPSLLPGVELEFLLPQSGNVNFGPSVSVQWIPGAAYELDTMATLICYVYQDNGSGDALVETSDPVRVNIYAGFVSLSCTSTTIWGGPLHAVINMTVGAQVHTTEVVPLSVGADVPLLMHLQVATVHGVVKTCVVGQSLTLSWATSSAVSRFTVYRFASIELWYGLSMIANLAMQVDLITESFVFIVPAVPSDIIRMRNISFTIRVTSIEAPDAFITETSGFNITEPVVMLSPVPKGGEQPGTSTFIIAVASIIAVTGTILISFAIVLTRRRWRRRAFAAAGKRPLPEVEEEDELAGHMVENRFRHAVNERQHVSNTREFADFGERDQDNIVAHLSMQYARKANAPSRNLHGASNPLSYTVPSKPFDIVEIPGGLAGQQRASFRLPAFHIATPDLVVPSIPFSGMETWEEDDDSD
jgi:hypothetical protein